VIDCWDDDLFKNKGLVYLLPFLKGNYTIWGLVDQAVCLSKGQFQRVGCFSFLTPDSPEHQENYVLNFLEILEKIRQTRLNARILHLLLRVRAGSIMSSLLCQ
jgi:hypothetical protein